MVEKRHLIDGRQIAPGDVASPSARQAFIPTDSVSYARSFSRSRVSVDQVVPELDQTVGQALIRPTTIYTSIVRQVLGHYKVKNVVHGIAHITGGGLLENTERILPKKVDLVFDRSSWQVPPLFDWLQKLGKYR